MPEPMSVAATTGDRPGSALEVLLAFTKLGVSSFGGPIAHIGYFRQEFVVRRRWLDERAYAVIVALCQFLPGPASSQVSLSASCVPVFFGGLAAWTGFTLPSAIALVLFAYGATALAGPIGSGLLQGLNRSRWPSWPRRSGGLRARQSQRPPMQPSTIAPIGAAVCHLVRDDQMMLGLNCHLDVAADDARTAPARRHRATVGIGEEIC